MQSDNAKFEIHTLMSAIIITACIFALTYTAAYFTSASGTIISEQYYDGWKVTQYNDISGGQGSFYTLTTHDGHLIVIDGGWEANEPQVRKVISQLGGHVDAWIISHPHQDHIGAFNKIYANPQNITIDKIYDSPVDYNTVVNAGEKWDDIDVFTTYLTITEGDDRITHLWRGDELELYGLNIMVINSYDRYVLENSGDLTNDSSLMLKITNVKDSMIFCGDIKYQMEDIITDLYKDQLTCTYIQAAHHGNWSFSEEFYDALNADVVLFDSPSWIMDDAQYPAHQLRTHMLERGMKVYDHSTSPNCVYLN